MIGRLLSLGLVAWILGFAWFGAFLPQPLDGRATDAIVVLTGGAGRIDRGLALLKDGAAKRMLISGVDRSVRPVELAVRYKAPTQLFDCCVTLGREAIDTRSNALETARWLDRRDFHTVRLITTDWHMRRAALELRQALPPDVTLVYDAVPARPSLTMLFKEYNKYLLRRIVALIGI
ncbi:YdcF family protein [Sphingobium algorifonticola]|uniref:YdcF family protein n=1 Tax=Sphingobium algorifonticola TaxID=2008318 RepID=A0A437JE82_9SPHN|nr:YdcF family protein [Sphingobium algorifonticola]RVT44043.1 YdcF family protein [Sphingobium algorifonticola]